MHYLHLNYKGIQMVFWILFVTSIVINIATLIGIRNLLRKNEIYESVIEEFYANLSVILHTVRALDEKRMFETDDEVGSVFQQIVDVLNALRPILYGSDDEEKA